MCTGTTCTFQVKLPAIAGTCRYRAGTVQERQNTCTVQVNLPAFLGKFTCTFFRVNGFAISSPTVAFIAADLI